MDISKMYCKAGSGRENEFISLSDPSIRDGLAERLKMKHCKCVAAVVDEKGVLVATFMDDDGSHYRSNYGMTEFVGSWNIYNNTLPLSELSDEQRGLLFNYRFNGGDITIYGGSVVTSPTWGKDSVYRAKQKSERELFIDAVSKVLGYTDLPITKIGGGLFDAKFKAPKVGE